MTKEQLRALRKGAGLTQADFGAALHLSGAYVGEMERGEKAIQPGTADLARLLFGKRVTTGKMGENFVIIISEPATGSPPHRIHRVHPSTYETFELALAAGMAIAEANGWVFGPRLGG